MRILGVSGSTRPRSANTAIVDAARLVAPPGVHVERFDGIVHLPFFDPDADDARPHPAVAWWRAELARSNALLLCSPEYAHGISGVLKNALDWLVGTGELMGMPTAVINASPHAVHADAALRETVSVMMAEIVPAASIVVPAAGRGFSPERIATDPELGRLLREATGALAAAGRSLAGGGGSALAAS